MPSSRGNCSSVEKLDDFLCAGCHRPCSRRATFEPALDAGAPPTTPRVDETAARGIHRRAPPRRPPVFRLIPACFHNALNGSSFCKYQAINLTRSFMVGAHGRRLVHGMRAARLRAGSTPEICYPCSRRSDLLPMSPVRTEKVLDKFFSRGRRSRESTRAHSISGATIADTPTSDA